MSTHPIAELSDSEFDQLVEGFIERSAAAEDELPADTFIDLLLTRASERAGTPVTLFVDIRNNSITIAPGSENADIIVEGNEVLVGDRRLILQLVQPAE